MTYAEQHNVATDAAGWPVGITPAERDRLVDCLRPVLARGPQPLHELYASARYRAALPTGCLLDYLYACVDRAARAVDGCELLYAVPGTHARMSVAVRDYGRRIAEWRAARIGELGSGKPADTRRLMLSTRALIEATKRALLPGELKQALCMFGELPDGPVAEELPQPRKPRAARADATAHKLDP